MTSEGTLKVIGKVIGKAIGAPVVFVALLLTTATAARAQEDTVVMGGVGGAVRVDLSVLDDLDRGYRSGPDFASGSGDDLRFPGSPVGPGEAVRLLPPDARPLLKRPSRKAARRGERPAKKAAATGTARGTPPVARFAAPPAAGPPPPPEAMAAPRPLSDAPRPQSTAPSRSLSVAPPLSAPTIERATVPPPPPPPAAPKASARRGGSPEFPAVTPAPSASIEARKIAPPPPAAAKAPAQTAALPKAPKAAPSGRLGAGAIRVIAFAPGASNLPSEAEATLLAAVAALGANPALRVQLKAYAAGDKEGESRARRLSLSRALGVRSFLIKEGVQPTRIDVRALGSNVPDGTPDRVDVSLVTR